MRLVVTTTIGGCSAWIVPTSGTVTWLSASTSSRNASNASSARSSSSIRRIGRAGDVGLKRLQDRPLDQEAVGEDVLRQRLAVDVAGGFGEPDLHHLRRVVPLVDGGGDVEPLVALEADQLAPERLGQNLGDLGLADAGLALEEERPAHLQREEEHGRKRPVGDVAGGGEEGQRVVDGGGDGQACGLGKCGWNEPLYRAGAGTHAAFRRGQPGRRVPTSRCYSRSQNGPHRYSPSPHLRSRSPTPAASGCARSGSTRPRRSATGRRRRARRSSISATCRSTRST